MIKEIRNTFIKEASLNLELIEQGIQKYSSNDSNPELAEIVYRTMHTLKGSGPMFGFDYLPEITQPIEKAYQYLFQTEAELSEEVITKTSEVVAFIKESLSNPDTHLPESWGKKSVLIEFFNNLCQLNAETHD
ncbi:hypothetical protein DMA11_02415 [Marinilabiliaceae bacterium JC017]|nr:hypothetical protein DMA11_02415 [Marinilabiliaceae bacterium JC017]